MKFIVCILIALTVFPQISFSQTPQEPIKSSPRNPKWEVRGAWVVTAQDARGASWPKSYSAEEQKRALSSIIQTIRNANLNTVVLQVRARGDLLYPSRYEPFAQSLTGQLGGDPGYDPLRFAVDETHKLGMEFHAWWNVAKVAVGPDRPPLSNPPHIVNAHKDWVKLWANRDRNGRVSGTEWWLDMGIPDVRSYLVGLVMEMVRTYDLDGIHFDFLRYPGQEFDDEKTYRSFGGGIAKDEWRRENINKFVRAVYDSIIAVKPMMKVGSAPIGIYKNLSGAEGWQGYVDVYQDARRWLAEKKHDYLVPQLYWNIQGKPRFDVLIRNWQENSNGRHVYAGVGAYKPSVLSEIPALIDSTRSSGALGNCYFAFDDISKGGVFADRYRYIALIPPMSWKDSVPPNPPTNLLAVEEEPGHYLLRWKPSPPATDGDTAKLFVLYRFLHGGLGIDDPSNILATLSGGQTSYRDVIERPLSVQYRYVVTALDKGNNESRPSNEAAVMIPQLASLLQLFEPIPVLGQNNPNPFSGVSFIPYEVKTQAKVELKILDAGGKEVVTLVSGDQEPGMYVVTIDGEKFAPGRYTYSLSAGEFTATKSMEIEK
jgi:uncharacterized lipoprotein YddW (UPF0748 family)